MTFEMLNRLIFIYSLKVMLLQVDLQTFLNSRGLEEASG